MEDGIRTIWAAVLGADALNGDSDFFDLGGDSLSAIHIMVRIEALYDTQLDITDVFDNSTLNAMAAVVRARTAGGMS